MLTWEKLLQAKRFRNSETVDRSEYDNRSAFKKDFDTVCNSTILRRLQDKAQVFPLEQEDYARTRLTHSIEVMSIAESLGYQVIDIINKNDIEYLSNNIENEANIDKVKAQINEIPNILKTAALLHDMGNPPFGHLGEKIIGDWFNNNLGNLVFNSDGQLVYNAKSEAKNTLEFMFKGAYAEDLKHFEGNAQLFRLVTKLSLFVDKNGMNLTYPVLASFIKYPTPSSEISKSNLLKHKMGYFTSEKDLYDKINSELELGNYRHPLAFLLEAADDIAYLTADIEDAHKKGLISLDSIKNYLQQEKDDNLIKVVLDSIAEYELNANDMNYNDKECYVIHRVRVLIKGLMINSICEAFANSYEQIMKQEYFDELLEKSSSKKISKIFRKIEKENIYYCRNILENKTRAIAIITKLLEIYVPAIVNWDEEKDKNSDSSNNLLYLSLSENYRYICETANQKKYDDEKKQKEYETYNKVLLVTDQISGMTDSRALTIYKMLTAN